MNENFFLLLSRHRYWLDGAKPALRGVISDRLNLFILAPFSLEYKLTSSHRLRRGIPTDP